jgi:uncharacterized SAM-binding protein YcdF (DUF218 family)
MKGFRASLLHLPRRLARTTIVLLTLLGATQVVVTFTPVLSPWVHWLTGYRWDEPRGDTLVVLGADSINTGGSIGQSTYWRCVYAVDVWRKAHYRTIILSGDEATVRVMSDYVISQGIPKASIQLETNSLTTRDNALNSARLLAPKSTFAILSSDIHMRRAYGCFRKLGLRPLCIPAPDAGKRLNLRLARWSVFVEAFLETAKLVRYKVLGYV